MRCLAKNGMYYAGRARPGGGKMISMHREIAGARDGEDVDHRNRDSLDNRRRNLRKCTKSQNGANRPAQRDNSSGYKGVQVRGEHCFVPGS